MASICISRLILAMSSIFTPLNWRRDAVRQITNVRGGAFNPTVDAEGVVYFSAYTADGFEIRQIRDEGPDVVLVQEPRSASSTSVKRPALSCPRRRQNLWD